MGYEARSPWLRGFLKVFALWAGLTSTPGLFLALNNFSSGRFSLNYLGQLVVLHGVGAVFGLIGAAAYMPFRTALLERLQASGGGTVKFKTLLTVPVSPVL